MYTETQLPSFFFIGLPCRTSLERAQAEIGAHWDRFYRENWFEKIPNRLNNFVYGLYTDYEGDYTDPYTLLVGTEVSSLASIPEGLTPIEVPAQKYAQFETEGELPQALVNKWIEIWNTPIERAYTFDFEKFDGGVGIIHIALKT